MKKIAILSVCFLVMSFFSIESYCQKKKIHVQNEGLEDTTPVENRFAFVVGIDHYEDPRISSLASCRLDAVRFSAFLKSNAGWRLPKDRLRILLDAPKNDIMKDFEQLLNSIPDPNNSTLYFYFSGHGVKGNMVPSDYVKGQAETLLSYSWIKESLDKAGVKAQVFVVDACYSGSILDTKSSEGFDEGYLAAIEEDPKENRVVFTATNSYRVTAAGRHESMYTKYFLNAIENEAADTNRDGILSSGELFTEIEARIGSLNVPQFAGSTSFPMANLKPINLESLASQRTTGSPRISPLENSMTRTRAVATEENTIVHWRQELETKSIDIEEAEAIISDLKNSNTPECKAKIGFLYREGIGVEKDINKALSYFIPSAADGSSFAEYNLGYMYSQGIGLTKDMEKAIEFYAKAAEKGDPFAQNNYGNEYAKAENGFLEYDFDSSVYWFEKAALQGNHRSQLALAQLYKKKSRWTVLEPHKTNYLEQAYYWFHESSKLNNRRAQYELGKCYEFGLGVEIDLEKAKHWYKRACENGQLLGCRKLLMMEYEEVQ